MSQPLPLLGLASASLTPFVKDLGLALVMAAGTAVVFQRLRLPVIAAFLLAGVVLGPIGADAIADRATIAIIANLGLTLLLFAIGLELDLHTLLARGRTLLVTGLIQVPLTAAIGTALFLALATSGWALLQGRYVGLYFGITCAFSSTLLVVKLLQARLQLDSIAGRMCVGLLIFQDVWAIILLALQPNLDDPRLAPILLTFAGIVVVAVVAFAGARWLLPPAFRLIAKIPELVVTLALGWCFGLGLFGAHLGELLALTGVHVQLSVSLEMGALISGASIATFPYSYEVVSRVANLRDFFLTLFFVALGMGIPAPSSLDILLLAGLVAACAVLLRFVVFLPLLHRTGLDRRNAFSVSVYLAQISEFCLVITYLGVQLGHLDPERGSIIIFAFVLTAVLTPGLFALADGLYRHIHALFARLGLGESKAVLETPHGPPPRLVILGVHRLASALIHDLERMYPELLSDTLVVDLNVATHAALRARGLRVVYGDMTSQTVLEHAGVRDAAVVFCSVSDELLKGASNAAVGQLVRAIAPGAQIFLTVHRASAVAPLYAAGADYVVTIPAEAAANVLPALSAAFNATLPSFRLERNAAAPREEVLP